MGLTIWKVDSVEVDLLGIEANLHLIEIKMTTALLGDYHKVTE